VGERGQASDSGSSGSVTIKPHLDFFVEKSFRAREVADFPGGFPLGLWLGCYSDASRARRVYFPVVHGFEL